MATVFTLDWLDHVVELNERVKRDTLELVECKTMLVEAGAHRYACRNDHEINVVYPAPKIAPEPDDIVVIEREIGPSKLRKCFTKITVWKPVKNVLDVMKAILTAAELKKVLPLAQRDCPAQVRIS